jgi:uncharacterized membrane protein
MEPEESHPSHAERGDLERSSTGLEPRLAAVLSYLFGFVSGIVFLVIERDSQYVRFHAMQSTVTFISLFVIRIVAEILPLIGNALGWLASAVSLVVWAMLMFKAWQGERYMLPMIGEMAEERTRPR